ncbi:MAG: glucose-1-phosphate cytidylyltransferase [Aureispira sp.]
MKTVIFAGGLGSRISEESHMRPKPMIEIAGKPILWHIMKMYQAHGFNEFIICLGYKGYMIKEYFINYFYHNSDITVDLANNQIEVHATNSENFKVTLVETGLNTMTAGRLQRIEKYIGEDEEFMLTYGDGVSDVDLTALVDFHRAHDKMGTVTTVQPAGKFGVLNADEAGNVTEFVEKPRGSGTWINGGFFVLNRKVFDYFKGKDMTTIMWEEDPMHSLVNDQELVSFKHHGFWKCMDILRDKRDLERLWASGNPAWKKW